MTIKPAPIIAIPNVPVTRVIHYSRGVERYDGIDYDAEAYIEVIRRLDDAILFAVEGDWT